MAKKTTDRAWGHCKNIKRRTNFLHHNNCSSFWGRGGGIYVNNVNICTGKEKEKTTNYLN